MGRLRIREAVAQFEMSGKEFKKENLYTRLWPTSHRSTQQINYSNLLQGNTKRVDVDWVPIICEELGCTANFLFENKEEQPAWLETLWNVNPGLADRAQKYLGLKF